MLSTQSGNDDVNLHHMDEISWWAVLHIFFHFGSSYDPWEMSVIRGYFIFFLSNSSWDQSKSLTRFANFGVESVSSIAAFNSLATCKTKN